MLKIAELIELADLFDSRGYTSAADACDQLIAEAADIEADKEVVLMRALAEKNFEAVKEQIRHGYAVLVLTPEKRNLEGDASTEISYVRGEVINSLNNVKIDFRTAPIVFENEKKKVAKDGAVLYIEGGAVKYLYPKDTGMSVLKDFFNKKVSIKQDLSSQIDQELARMQRSKLPELVERKPLMPGEKPVAIQPAPKAAPSKKPVDKKRPQWKAVETPKSEFREKLEEAIKDFDEKKIQRNVNPEEKKHTYERTPKGPAPRHKEVF